MPVTLHPASPYVSPPAWCGLTFAFFFSPSKLNLTLRMLTDHFRTHAKATQDQAALPLPPIYLNTNAQFVN